MKVDEDRRYEIEAAIVRVMKARKKMQVCSKWCVESFLSHLTGAGITLPCFLAMFAPICMLSWFVC